MQVDFSTKVEEFIAHEGPKLSYGKKPLGNEIFIRSTNLLFEQGINDVEIVMGKWDDVECFFQTRQEASVPFDIFAATFFLLSRYEEYLPHLRDEHDRYPAKDSLAFKEHFLHKPLIDIWAYKFKEILRDKNPTIELKQRKFEYISTIDVDIAYCFKHKGLFRAFGGYLNDLLKLRLYDVWDRTLVNLGFKKDPFDTFDDLIGFQKQYDIKTIFFFSVGDYTTFDKNTSSRNTSYQSLIKSVADYAEVGLHPSYFSPRDEGMLQKEKLRLEAIVNRPVEKSRQHYLRFDLPETYQNLINLEVKEDYTMGYASSYGFRASTCTPFYFYDLEFEIQTPLKVFPFAVMDGTLKDYLNLPNKKSFEVIADLANEVKKVDGTFITIFHNDTLSNRYRWRRWRKMYIDIFKMLTSTTQ